MCFVLPRCQPQNKINLTCSYFRLILISVMAETEDGIGQRLRLAELRLTPQRYAVLDFLVRSESHPTAEQVGAGVNRRFPRASRATVYNALHTLCEAGLVQELYFEDGVARYDANVGLITIFCAASAASSKTFPSRRSKVLPAVLSSRGIVSMSFTS